MLFLSDICLLQVLEYSEQYIQAKHEFGEDAVVRKVAFRSYCAEAADDNIHKKSLYGCIINDIIALILL